MATKATKPAAKAAPAPAVQEAAALEVGQSVRFLGYGEDTPAEDRILAEGEVYTIVGMTEPDENGASNPVVSVANDGFNPKKKEHPETNPKTLDVEVFPEEVELVEEEAAEEEAAPAAKAAPAKTAAKAAPAKAAPAKTAAKSVPAKAAPVKPAAKAAAKAAEAAAAAAEEAAAEEVDETPDLENEDPEVVALVEQSADLIATAQELEAEAGSIEWKLGGVLYHIKKSKSYESLEGGEEYAQPGGFQKFLMEYFNIEYRKAMYLIDIYKHFTLAGITDASAQVATMGWTKAKTIARLLTAEDANVEQLIDLANNNTVSDLSEAIKEQVRVGGTPGERKTRITLKFRYVEEEAATVNGILEAARDQLGLKDIGEALAHIVNEWASEHGGGTATKAAAPAQRAAAKKAAPAAAPAKRAAAKA